MKFSKLLVIMQVIINVMGLLPQRFNKTLSKLLPE